MKVCPMCGGELTCEPWVENDYYVAAKVANEVVGYAHCERCKMWWKIDYNAMTIVLHSVKKLCEECAETGYMEECLLVEGSEEREQGIMVCDGAHVYQMKITYERRKDLDS